ncbi:MAG: hypothetical protein M5T61_06040 [Acidimicrobiia bacterium]|nr:hypothetical protein [Acidimicrobiia bacterium]
MRAAIEDAQPIAVEGSVVVFGVPPRRLDAIRKRFQAEADTIRTALAGRLGRTPQFKLRSHDFEASGALDPTSPAATGSGKAPTAGGAGSAKAAGAVSAKAAGASTAGAAGAAGASTAGTEPENGGPGPEGTDPLDDRVDLAELVDAPADAALFEPTAMLQEQLGAEIVEERPRD